MRTTAIFIISAAAVLTTAQTKPIQSNDIPAETQANKEEVSQILFGERGILTGIFRMMDQQKKIKPAVQADSPGSPADAANNKIGNFDFKKIVDSLVTGAAEKGELGDHGAELPEFLGICNRLSCGDIYKAIDKFRKSEMFSNFQTALTLVNDPNGWETIGKLLSNPELISQFTAGSGMEELFGSALGEVKKESNITRSKNSKLMPEDGDFGIDFSEDGDSENVTKIEKPDPKVEFSVDMKGSEDYYSEVSNAGDDSAEYATVDQTPPPSTKITKSGPDSPNFKEKLPPISFSIDGGGEEENETETIMTAELPPPNTRILKRIHAGSTIEEKVTGHGGVGTQTMTRPNTFSTQTVFTTIAPTTVPMTVLTTRYSTTTTRARTTTTTRATTTARNFRKDNDYYAMYYDDGKL